MNNSIVFEEVLLTQNFNLKDRILEQTFNFNKRNKASKYIRDHRYILYDKLERKIRDLALFEQGTLTFIKRVDEVDHIKLTYEIEDMEAFKDIELNPLNFKLVDYVPPSPGCDFCIHKQNEEELWFYCAYKKKTITNKIKNCKYFAQKRLFKS